MRSPVSPTLKATTLEGLKKEVEYLLRLLRADLEDVPIIRGGDGISKNHAALNNLEYANAGHTGFEPTVTKGNLTAASPVTVSETRQVIGGAAEIGVTNGNLTAVSPLSFSEQRQVLGGATELSIDLSAIANSFGWQWQKPDPRYTWSKVRATGEESYTGSWADYSTVDDDTDTYLTCLNDTVTDYGYIYQVGNSFIDKIKIYGTDQDWINKDHFHCSVEAYVDGEWVEVYSDSSEIPNNQWVELEFTTPVLASHIRLNPLDSQTPTHTAVFIHEIQVHIFGLVSSDIGDL